MLLHGGARVDLLQARGMGGQSSGCSADESLLRHVAERLPWRAAAGAEPPLPQRGSALRNRSISVSATPHVPSSDKDLAG